MANLGFSDRRGRPVTAHERFAGLGGHHGADGAPKATNRIVRAGNISGKRTVPGPRCSIRRTTLGKEVLRRAFQ